jgi:polysaccharide pyruvyl transferase WcaK-like protein
MKVLKTLHLASFDGNIGDNANHYGFYKYLNENNDFKFDIEELEIREFYWKKRFFDKSFVKLVNSYDLLIIGGGNYFELWVEDSPTGTSIAIELDLLEQIYTPILFNALGVDPGQGASEKNINKFKTFLDLLIKRDDFISIRNDGAKKAIIDHVGEEYMKHINHTADAGFFIDVDEPSDYYKGKRYIAINVAYDMQEVRYQNLSYKEFLNTFKKFIGSFLNKYQDYEIVFIPHIFRDITFINDILEILDDDIRRSKISISPLLHGKDSFKKIMSIYKGASLVLANRFHANVCSIGLDIPTIGLVNYRQIQELYNELNSTQYIDVTKDEFDIKLLDLIPMVEKYDTSNIKSGYLKNIEKIELWLKENM